MNCIGKNFWLLLILGGLSVTFLAVSGNTAAQTPSEMKRELDNARRLNEQLKARLAAAEAALAQNRAVAVKLQQQLQQGQADRDKNLQSVVELTDQLHKAFNEVKRLKAENARLSALLPQPPANGREGLVIATQEKGLLEISLGSDDGLKPGQRMSVYRTAGKQITLLGHIAVVKIAGNKAVCRADSRSLKGAIRKGDRVTTGKPPAASLSTEPPKADEPPFLVGGTVLTVLQDGQVEISFGATDGLRPGHLLEIYRETGSQGIYVGRIEVIQAGPKKSRCKIVAEQDTVRKGDRITSKL